MNYSNVIIIISAILLAVIFLGSVFVNLEIKNSREELYGIHEKIKDLELEIVRQKIEITTLTNPYYVYEYISKNKLKPIPLSNIETIYIKKD
jgi:hypothetical protein